MRSRALVLGCCPCPVSETSSKCVRVVIALAAAIFCVGWLSSAAVADVICVEDDSYCRDVGLRCTYSGSTQTCCAYTCEPDETCTAAELQPLTECSPPEVDVHLHVYSGAAGCTLPEAKTSAYNQSTLYWYKLNATTTGDSQIWSCPDCYVTVTDTNQPIAPSGQSGSSFHQTIVFPSQTSCQCSSYAEGGCCDNCPSQYSEEPECVNKHCNSTSPHTGQVCASVTEDYKVVKWSEDGTYWKTYPSPVALTVYRFTSACSP